MNQKAFFHETFRENFPATNAEWRCLFILALHHYPECGAYPKMSTLVNLTGLDRKTVYRALKSLKKKELVKEEKINGRRTFFLPVDKHGVIQGGPGRWGHWKKPAVNGASVRLNGASVRLNGASVRQARGVNAPPYNARASEEQYLTVSNSRERQRKNDRLSTESSRGKKKHLGSRGAKEVIDPVDDELVEVERRRRLAEKLIEGGDKE
jgi:hypothetical protein